jgi:uncharacterized integral membrane protein
VIVVGRVVGLLFGFVAAVFLVTLAVANRHSAQLVLDPFNPTDPVLSIQLPFYAYLFGMLIVGVILGGIATWMGQSRWRRMARTRSHDVVRWRTEAERLSRERDARSKSAGQAADSRQLALTGR